MKTAYRHRAGSVGYWLTGVKNVHVDTWANVGQAPGDPNLFKYLSNEIMRPQSALNIQNLSTNMYLRWNMYMLCGYKMKATVTDVRMKLF